MVVDVIEHWFTGGLSLDRNRYATWTSCVGHCSIDFACTEENIARVAAARLIRSRTDAAEMRLCLLETRALDLPPTGHCGSQAESLRLARDLEDRGISAIIPVGSPDDSALWILFRKTDQMGLVVVDTAAGLPPWMVNAPFSLLLHLAFALRGQRLLHAASLGLKSHGALIVGPGGAGKSATTIAGVTAGLSTIGDDYLVLDKTPSLTAWPVYRTLKQSAAGLSRMPKVFEQTNGLVPNWHGKLEFDAEFVRPGCIARELTIDAILIPQQGGGSKTRLEPAPASAAFSALAPSTLAQLPGMGLQGFSQITRLTRSVPAHWLHLSRDPEEIGARLSDFLAGRSA